MSTFDNPEESWIYRGSTAELMDFRFKNLDDSYFTYDMPKKTSTSDKKTGAIQAEISSTDKHAESWSYRGSTAELMDFRFKNVDDSFFAYGSKLSSASNVPVDVELKGSNPNDIPGISSAPNTRAMPNEAHQQNGNEDNWKHFEASDPLLYQYLKNMKDEDFTFETIKKPDPNEGRVVRSLELSQNKENQLNEHAANHQDFVAALANMPPIQNSNELAAYQPEFVAALANMPPFRTLKDNAANQQDFGVAAAAPEKAATVKAVPAEAAPAEAATTEAASWYQNHSNNFGLEKLFSGNGGQYRFDDPAHLWRTGNGVQNPLFNYQKQTIEPNRNSNDKNASSSSQSTALGFNQQEQKGAIQRDRERTPSGCCSSPQAFPNVKPHPESTNMRTAVEMSSFLSSTRSRGYMVNLTGEMCEAWDYEEKRREMMKSRRGYASKYDKISDALNDEMPLGSSCSNFPLKSSVNPNVLKSSKPASNPAASLSSKPAPICSNDAHVSNNVSSFGPSGAQSSSIIQSASAAPEEPRSLYRIPTTESRIKEVENMVYGRTKTGKSYKLTEKQKEKMIADILNAEIPQSSSSIQSSSAPNDVSTISPATSNPAASLSSKPAPICLNDAHVSNNVSSFGPSGAQSFSNIQSASAALEEPRSLYRIPTTESRIKEVENMVYGRTKTGKSYKLTEKQKEKMIADILNAEISQSSSSIQSSSAPNDVSTFSPATSNPAASLISKPAPISSNDAHVSNNVSCFGPSGAQSSSIIQSASAAPEEPRSLFRIPTTESRIKEVENMVYGRTKTGKSYKLTEKQKEKMIADILNAEIPQSSSSIQSSSTPNDASTFSSATSNPAASLSSKPAPISSNDAHVSNNVSCFGPSGAQSSLIIQSASAAPEEPRSLFRIPTTESRIKEVENMVYGRTKTGKSYKLTEKQKEKMIADILNAEIPQSSSSIQSSSTPNDASTFSSATSNPAASLSSKPAPISSNDAHVSNNVSCFGPSGAQSSLIIQSASAAPEEPRSLFRIPTTESRIKEVENMVYGRTKTGKSYKLTEKQKEKMIADILNEK